jgi:polyisoprenoid-binding protein YceI
MLRSLMVIVATLLIAAPAAAEVEIWNLDAAHSAAQFSVRHLGISTVRGAFTRLSGTLKYDPADLTKTSLEATIDTTSVDTRVEVRDKDLRGPSYFDVEKFPTMTFVSKRVEAAGTGKLRVTGDLTMHGVTKEVVLEVDGPSPPIQDRRGNSHMGASATTKINRSDFGVSGGAAVVSDEVTITIDAEFVKPQKP